MTEQRNDYDARLWTTYHEGRRFSTDSRAAWATRLGQHVRPGVRVLDLGCGTGRFARLLADRFGARVTGVDVAAKMLGVAARKNGAGAARFARGRAERLPVRDGEFHLAFLSMVVHHFTDLDAACAELARVLRKGGRVFVRGSYGGRLGDVPFYRFFDAAKRIDDERFPTREEVERRFAAAGFRLKERDTVWQRTDADLAAYRKRLEKRPYSTFEFMTEEDIARGFAALDAAEPGPFLDPVDLDVFEVNR